MNRAVYKVLGQVFTEGSYMLLAAVVGLSLLIFVTWLPNLGLVWQVLTLGSVPLLSKIEILAALVGSLNTNFSPFSIVITIAMAMLFGANVALIIYYFRHRQRLVKQASGGMAATSLGGLASGFLGVGCAACGSFILSPALTFFGVGTLVASLPLGGEEFGLLGLAMLALSLILGARKINQLTLCSR